MQQFRGYAVKVERVTIGEQIYELLAPADVDRLLDDPAVESRFRRTEYMPYWATLWPAALVLADEVAQWPVIAPDDEPPHVLELGCGLGLVGLVASIHGYRVTATDYDQDALAFVEENARRNRVPMPAVRALDWCETFTDLRPERILAADVLYEARNLRPVAEFIRRHLAPAGFALVSDPCRATADGFAEVAGVCGLVAEVWSRSWTNALGVPIPACIYRLAVAGR
jgi:predicted nicotinamide N-methyase